jgi:hypothetical protein
MYLHGNTGDILYLVAEGECREGGGEGEEGRGRRGGEGGRGDRGIRELKSRKGFLFI